MNQILNMMKTIRNKIRVHFTSPIVNSNTRELFILLKDELQNNSTAVTYNKKLDAHGNVIADDINVKLLSNINIKVTTEQTWALLKDPILVANLSEFPKGDTWMVVADVIEKYYNARIHWICMERKGKSNLIIGHLGGDPKYSVTMEYV